MNATTITFIIGILLGIALVNLFASWYNIRHTERVSTPLDTDEVLISDGFVVIPRELLLKMDRSMVAEMLNTADSVMAETGKNYVRMRGKEVDLGKTTKSDAGND